VGQACVILPFLVWGAVFLMCGSRGYGARESVLAASIVWGVLVTVLTEVLSAFGLLRFAPVCTGWALAAGLALGLLYSQWKTDNVRRLFSTGSLTGLSPGLLLLLGCTGLLVVGIGILAFLAPPNTWDSMTYHMGRVAHWVQNGSVAHYPTHITRQLYLNPWAEFAICHLQILWHGDRFANLVQYSAMLGSLAGVTLIAQRLGAGPTGQVLTCVCAATVPMGILQASGTQTDYAVAFWLVAFVYFGLQASFPDVPLPECAGDKRGCDTRTAGSGKRRPSHTANIVAAGAALGLAWLTKGTSFFYGLPFALWFMIAHLRTSGKESFKAFVLVTAIVLALTLPHLLRNVKTFGHPVAPAKDSQGAGNREFSLRLILSNTLKNAGLHMGTPLEPINRVRDRGINLVHKLIGVDVNDPATSYGGHEFKIPETSRHEDDAGNLLHFLLLCGVGSALILQPSMRNPMLLRYAACVVAGVVLLCVVIRWTPWNSRYHVPFFVLASPLIGLTLNRCVSRKVAIGIALVLFLGSGPFLLFGKPRCLLGERSALVRDRTAQYFLNDRPMEEQCRQAVHAAESLHPHTIGLLLGGDDWEYPLWVLLKPLADRGSCIVHVCVTNESRDAEVSCQSSQKRPDCIIGRVRNGRPSVPCMPDRYRVYKDCGQIALFVPQSQSRHE
jgi:hypothetical protein